MTTTGGCLCGAVRYRVEGPMRPVIACHCNQCRKTSGHHVAATAAHRTTLTVEGEEALTWYRSSDAARRGFCKLCGSQLFWDRDTSDMVSIFAGTLDGETGLTTSHHIHAGTKGDYYELPAGVSAYPAEKP